MQNTTLDSIDQRILEALQQDARLSSQDLAEQVNLTPSPCWRRVKRLEEQGVIRGYRADLDAERLGFVVTAFVSVMLETHRADMGEAFESAVGAIPEVLRCHNISGRYDYLLEVVAPDLQHFGEFARNRLRTLPGVKEIYSSFVLKDVKQGRQLPIRSSQAVAGR
jgi:Lrp/AsnC family leucine-responsive transcriptional regulator